MLPPGKHKLLINNKDKNSFAGSPSKEAEVMSRGIETQKSKICMNFWRKKTLHEFCNISPKLFIHLNVSIVMPTLIPLFVKLLDLYALVVKVNQVQFLSNSG